MNLYLFLSALRSRFRVFALVLLATVFVTAGVSFILPKKYVATVSLMVDSKDEQSMSPGASQRQQLGYLQTQTDVIGSMKVARRVVRDLRLTDSPTARKEFEKDTGGKGSFEDWLAENLLRYLKVDTSQSSVLQLTYSSSDPKFAALVANAFARSYLDTVLELRVEPTRRAAAWFDEQLKGLRENLEKANARLSAYQREKGIVATEERFDVESARLAELSTQLVQAQTSTYDARTREQAAQDALKKGLAPDRLPEVIANPFIQSLKTSLLLGEAKLQEMSSQYGPNYPLYQRQASEVRSLRERLDLEMRKIVNGLESAAQQTSSREAALQAALGAQRARVLQMKELRNELGVMGRDVETAQRAYDTAMQRWTISKVESRANNTNVTVLTGATEPLKPTRPKIALNIALAAIVGTMFGMAIVFLMETFDRRVRTYEDLDGSSVPVLAVLHGWESRAGRLLARPSGINPGYALPKPA